MTKRKTTPVTKKTTPLQNNTTSVPVPHTIGHFDHGGFWKKYWIEVVGIMALSFVLYFSCIPYEYVLDDQIVITGNAYTKKGFSGIKDIFTTESFEGYFGTKKELVQGNRYRPLSIVTFAMEYGIVGGLNPKLSHIINILWYGLTGILLFMVLQMLFRNVKSPWRLLSVPLLATVIFMVHPIHTEAVANIKGRDEIMSMFFSLMSLYFGLKYMDKPGRMALLGSCFTYFLGLLSKENAITFLAVIPLTVYFFSETDWKKLGKLMTWLAITTIGYLILRFNTAGVPKMGQEIADLMNNPFLGMSGAQKFGSIFYTLGKYIMLMIFPHPLSHDYYPYAIPKVSFFSLWPLLSFMGYLILAYFGIKGYKNKSVYSYSILYYICTLSIVSNILINLGTFMNERFIFMASAGFCIAVSYFLSNDLPRLHQKWGSKVAMAIAAVLVIGYGWKTLVRVPVWKDALSLNEAAVAVSSNSARANSFMSTAIFEEYKVSNDQNKKKELLDKAEFYGLKAVDIVPDYHSANLMLIGVASERYKMNGDINQYITSMKPCILRRPDVTFISEFSDYLKDRGHNEALFPFYLEIGKTLLSYTDKRRDYAYIYLTYAYGINPISKEVNENLATAYDLAGRPNDANKYRSAAQYLQ